MARHPLGMIRIGAKRNPYDFGPAALVTQPAQLTFPNPRNISENRAALIFGLDDIRAEITLRGLGHVRNGLVEADDGIQGSLDVLGYLTLSETQESAVLARLNGTDTGDQGTFLDDLLDILKINEAHAQFLGGVAPIYGALNNLTTHASLGGRVELAQRTAPTITSSPSPSQSLRFSYAPQAVGGRGAVTFKLEGQPALMTLTNGVISFTPRANGPLTFDVVAVDSPPAGAPPASSRQTIRLDVEGNVIHVVVTGTSTDDDGSLVALNGVRVELGVSGLSTSTGESGGFGFNVPTYGCEMTEVVIASMDLGTFPVVRRDADGRVRIEQVQTTHYARSPVLSLFQDTVFRTSVIVDAHLLKGTVTFVDDDGIALPAAIDQVPTTWDDATSRVLQARRHRDHGDPFLQAQ
jgi:hypothetical protein